MCATQVFCAYHWRDRKRQIVDRESMDATDVGNRRRNLFLGKNSSCSKLYSIADGEVNYKLVGGRLIKPCSLRMTLCDSPERPIRQRLGSLYSWHAPTPTPNYLNLINWLLKHFPTGWIFFFNPKVSPFTPFKYGADISKNFPISLNSAWHIWSPGLAWEWNSC